MSPLKNPHPIWTLSGRFDNGPGVIPVSGVKSAINSKTPPGKKILTNEPTTAELENKRGMKLFLRATRLLYTELANPLFPDRSLAPEVAIRLPQLEDLWQIIHNPRA